MNIDYKNPFIDQIISNSREQKVHTLHPVLAYGFTIYINDYNIRDDIQLDSEPAKAVFVTKYLQELVNLFTRTCKYH